MVVAGASVGIAMLIGLGVTAPTLALVQVTLLGYMGGRFHAAHHEERQARARLISELSRLVNQMGAALADDELTDDERTFVQRQRTELLGFLGLMDAPPLHQRLRARLHR